MPKLVKVVFDIPVNDSFDYISENEKAEIGSRVKVSFGKTTRIGIIIEIIAADSKPKTYKIKVGQGDKRMKMVMAGAVDHHQPKMQQILQTNLEKDNQEFQGFKSDMKKDMSVSLAFRQCIRPRCGSVSSSHGVCQSRACTILLRI